MLCGYMLKKFHLLAFFMFFCPFTWATVEITGANTFKYTDSDGNTKTRQIHGYTKPENIDHYLQSAISDSKTILQIDRDLSERTISKVYFVQFSADPEGFIEQSENIGFIIILNDGTALLNFDFLCSPAPVVSTCDPSAANAKLRSHLLRCGDYIGEVSQGAMTPLGLWSTASTVSRDLKQFGFQRDKEKTDRYQATFLIPNLRISGQGTLEIRNLGTYQYTILESSS